MIDPVFVQIIQQSFLTSHEICESQYLFFTGLFFMNKSDRFAVRVRQPLLALELSKVRVFCTVRVSVSR